MKICDNISEINDDQDLVFIDIEATDSKGEQRIIQFSGYRLNIKKIKFLILIKNSILNKKLIHVLKPCWTLIKILIILNKCQN